MNLGLFSLIMVVGGMIHGAFFMWIAMRKDTKEGTPSASHNRPSVPCSECNSYRDGGYIYCPWCGREIER